MRAELALLLAAARSVAVEHGLGPAGGAGVLQRPAEQHGARWRLLVLRATREELVRRLAERPDDDGFGPMDAELLDRMAAASHEPVGEGEEVVHTGAAAD